MRTSAALRLGINSRTLYAMRDRGLLTALSRGIYHLKEIPLHGWDDLVTIAHRVPKARICLISALAFHELTTQIPHEIYCALPRDVHHPRIEHPPVRCFRFSHACYESGVEYHDVAGARLAVYSAEKTLADCFKYRNQIGMDSVLEAMRLYRERNPLNIRALLEYAKMCRVQNILKPYLEATL